MRSGIGPADVLSEAGIACQIAAPDLGRNLQDHLLGAGNLYAARRVVPPSRLQHSESMAYMRAGEFKRGGRPEIVVGCGIAPIVSERFTPMAMGTAYSLLFGVTHPTSRGSLSVTGPEAGDALRIDPAYLQTEHDRRLFREALAAARSATGASSMTGASAKCFPVRLRPRRISTTSSPRPPSLIIIPAAPAAWAATSDRWWMPI
jgi:choline dehydrogenase-like flavoprotein